LDDEAYKVRRHKTEWHNKFTVSFACLVFFFIGAPLGAIIRKGGLGTPVVISVFLFIFYYVINNIGFKMARDGVWSAWEGMWLSSAVLAPLGIFLTYKAAHDSVILNSDTYLNAIKKLFGKKEGRIVERKEVIIYNSDYKEIRPRLVELIKNCQTYITGHRRWIHYIRFWENGGRDYHAEMIAKEMESIIEELSNSDQNLVLNKLMDYPIISGYMKINSRINNKLGVAVGLFIPIGLPIYLLAVYQRKLLRHDIETVKKASEDMVDIIDNEKLITEN
jgi:lipopolysaccharide export system permease protein